MEREVELGAQQGERRSELVAGLRDEAALAFERRLEASEHLVEGRAEALELVAGRRHGQALAGPVSRDSRRAATHRLDRAQARSGEQVAQSRCEHERDRARQEQLRAQVAKRLGPVLARGAHDQDEAPAAAFDRKSEQSGALVQAGHGRTAEERRPAERPPKAGAAK